jgi:hypothetical protein
MADEVAPDQTTFAMITLREFVCKDCGHKVVVHPRLPLHYTPNLCCECYERGEPQRQALSIKIMKKVLDLMHICGVNG